MNQPAKASEPSMEEILASIRRIIADDDATKQPLKPAAPAKPPEQPAVKATPPPVPQPVAQDDIDAVLAELDETPVEGSPEAVDDVLELTEAMEAAPPEASPPSQGAFRRIDPAQDVVFDDLVQAQPPAPNPVTRALEPEGALLSNAASAAVHSAFGNLAHSMLVHNSRTLEDLVREMLRPMLKAWLDDNLPVMVERLVRAEIERVSRGPRT